MLRWPSPAERCSKRKRATRKSRSSTTSRLAKRAARLRAAARVVFFPARRPGGPPDSAARGGSSGSAKEALDIARVDLGQRQRHQQIGGVEVRVPSRLATYLRAEAQVALEQRRQGRVRHLLPSFQHQAAV